MDRRRFAPSTERLDGRVLLTASPLTLVSTRAIVNLAQTARLSQLDDVLDSLAPGRVVPETLVAPLQADLTAIVGKLANPGAPVLAAFNTQLRGTISHPAINAADEAGLNATFGNALNASAVPISVTNHFQNDALNLLKFDQQNPNPTAMAARDYATIFNMALLVGRPIPTPLAPRLLASDAVGGKGSHVTSNPSPSLVGAYNDAGSSLTLLDQSGNVLGTDQVNSAGIYQLQPSQPLAPGTYVVRVLATDLNGDHSEPSQSFRLIVQAAS